MVRYAASISMQHVVQTSRVNRPAKGGEIWAASGGSPCWLDRSCMDDNHIVRQCETLLS